jgi:hypothetical protein
MDNTKMLENLANVQGRLVVTYSQLDPDTIQTAAEISNQRRESEKLRHRYFWTRDTAIYDTEKDEGVLYLTLSESPIFKNIREATKQLAQDCNYQVKQEDLEAAVNAQDTLKVALSDLDLRRHNGEYSVFEINTTHYNKTLNAAQRTVAERAFGSGEDFDKNMATLKEAGFSKTKVYTLNPRYVKKHAKDGAVARACQLYGFRFGSGFDAGERGVDIPNHNWLRGVPRIAVDDAAEKQQNGTPHRDPAFLPIDASVKVALDQKEAFEYQGTLYVPVRDRDVKLRR